MECPNCQFQNIYGVKFCNECGFQFIVKCQKCNIANPPGSKFCNECGHDLTKAPAENPPEIIPAQPIIADQERKYVTVLFSDLSGYTAITEKLDPEEVKEIMGRIFGEIALVVVKYEGFIEKYVGDAILALFGVPKSHEDDPVRAIRAAREIHELVSKISSSLEKKIDRSLYMHSGINTGLVITGDINLEKGTHGVLGDTINIASRLSELAQTDEIFVGMDTHHQSEGYFNFQKLGPSKVKGKEVAVPIYKVLSPKEVPTKIHRLSGLRADLIGRRVEMAQLKEAVSNLKQGKSSIFSIVGEAGTGKSRLIEEFKNTLDLEEVQWREGHAYAYSQNIPYFPLIDLLNRAWLIKEGDPPEQARLKVETGTKALISEKTDLIPYIGSLYSLHYAEIADVSPETWKARLHEAIRLILSNLCKRGPTIICIEDLQCSDNSTVELLRNILMDLKYRAIFLCIYRPTFSLFTSHQLNRVKSYQEIRVQDLSSSESQDMLESLLKTKDIPTDVRKFIQDKVEGNPLYMEEAINALIESDILIREDGKLKLTKSIAEANIPYTVQGIISARLDRLERETKRILQEASVIGRTFLYDILRRITELKEHLDRSLNGLERLDFIRTRAIQPDLEYIFKHALTQDVVYNGILKKERQIIHEKIGQVMEELFHDDLEEFYETLAYHFKQGRSLLKAVDYLRKAGEKSFSRYAVNESHEYYKEAFDLLTNKPDRTQRDNELLIDLLIDWGLVFFHRAAINEMMALYKDHEGMVLSLGDKVRLGMFYVQYGGAFQRMERPRESYQYLSKALEIGKETGNEKITGYALVWLTYACVDLGQFDKAVEFGEKVPSLTIYKSDRELFRLSAGGRGTNYFFMGEGRKTHETGDELLKYGQKHSDNGCTAHGYFLHGWGYMVEGVFPDAIESFRKGIQVAIEPLHAISAKSMLGYAYIGNGQYLEAENILNEVNEYCSQFGFSYSGTPAKGLSGMVMITKGEFEQGIKMGEETTMTFLENENLAKYVAGSFLQGKVYLQIFQLMGGMKDFSAFGDQADFLKKSVPIAHDKAEEYFKVAINKAKEIGAKSYHGQACLDLGRLYKLQGRMDEARQYITDAVQILERIEANGFLKQAQEELASLN